VKNEYEPHNPKLAHALHGQARQLIYSSPVTGEMVIFDHDQF
jgi:hypothetical protein